MIICDIKLLGSNTDRETVLGLLVIDQQYMARRRPLLLGDILMRIIRLAFTVTDKIKLHELTNYIEVDKALAYLTQWALDAEDKSACTIMIHGDEMTAVYRPNFDEDGPPTYVIGAVWHQDHFGYHS